jgi:L-aminopeptidase/D-esterase-like protein
MNRTITGVPGVRAGHASYDQDRTGCTVLLGPFRAAVDIRGLATGTREMDALSTGHVVPQVDAILLTGGSALGLAAADGVVQWLRERDLGFDVGVVRIPIVPAAVIFDIRQPQQRHPDAALGHAAAMAATAEPLPEGGVGAGAGATVGKLLGPGNASPGGVGTFAVEHGGHTVGALAVVNAFGDVLDHEGRIIAGARRPDGTPLDSMMAAINLRNATHAPITNTTLCAIATDAPLSRTALRAVARMGSSAIVRRIAPANTIFDGDLVFALSTSAAVAEIQPADLLAIGAAAQLALEEAIIRAVRIRRGDGAPANG